MRVTGPIRKAQSSASPARPPRPASSLRPEGAPFSVVKFGSSVLDAPSDARRVAAEIARLSSFGEKTLAVVSAFRGETDRLIAEAAALSGAKASRHAAALVSLGEARAALALAVACEAQGAAAAFVDVEAIALRAEGPCDEATPVDVDAVALADAVRSHDVVIVPGFVAMGADGRRVLLGRGGSDLTAVFLARALGLGVATLVKDVDGVYDRDPARYADARRLDALGWSEAEAVAGRLVQARAIRFAAAHGIAIAVRRLGEDRATLIGDAPSPSAC